MNLVIVISAFSPYDLGQSWFLYQSNQLLVKGVAWHLEGVEAPPFRWNFLLPLLEEEEEVRDTCEE